MSTKTRDALIDVLADLGSLHPDLRFGQLMEMIALFADDALPLSLAEIDDDQLLNTASDHAGRRRKQLTIDDESFQEWRSPESRTELWKCSSASGCGTGINDSDTSLHNWQHVRGSAFTTWKTGNLSPRVGAIWSISRTALWSKAVANPTFSPIATIRAVPMDAPLS